MKRIFFISILLLYFIACKKNSPANNEIIINKDTLSIGDNDAGAKMLADFYFSCYINEENFNNTNLKRKFISKTILKRIDSLRNGENLILDYDPFIKGQDYNANTIKSTLEIKPLKNKNEYRVSFLLFGDKTEKKTNIDFILEKNENGNFVIASILNDEYLNINVANKNLNITNKIDLDESLLIRKWYGNYEGSFLRMKEESADPRSWATINLKLSKDSTNFYLFSYIEEKNFKLKLIKVKKERITFDMENNNTIIINNTKNKWPLESSFINNLIGEKKIIELTKK